jgi:type IV fimbrial biogenesis protein FimT
MSLKRRQGRGFTAIELLIVLTIAGILLAIAVPNFADFLQRYRTTTAANEILRTLSMARSRALATGERVAIAPTADGNWSAGWRVFIDSDNDGVYDATETVLEDFAGLDSDFSLSGSTFGQDGKTFISFNQFGFARALNGTTVVSGRIGVTLGSHVRSICLSANGRAEIVKGSSC